MMIHARGEDATALQQALSSEPAFSVRTAALAEAYGLERPFFNVWRQENGALLSRLENSFFVYGGDSDGCDFDELACFLEFNPYFSRLAGEKSFVESIAARMSGDYNRSEYSLMICKNAEPATALHNINSTPDLHAVYEVMQSARDSTFAVGDYTAWYADLSHRIRHGCACAYLIEADGEPASVGLVSVRSRFAGLISGVATKPAYRNRGYASALVKKAASDLTVESRLPVIECLQHLTGYYAGLGFAEYGKILEIEAV